MNFDIESIHSLGLNDKIIKMNSKKMSQISMTIIILIDIIVKCGHHRFLVDRPTTKNILNDFI